MKLAQQLAALRERIRQRVDGHADALPDLRLPSHERLARIGETAENWAAQVGAANPRPGGIHNKAIQAMKRAVARSLRWQSLAQREFNRSMLDALAEIRAIVDQQNHAFTVIAQATVQMMEHREALEKSQAELEGSREQARQEFQAALRDQGTSFDGRLGSNLAALKAEMDARINELDWHLKRNVEWLNDHINGVQKALWSYQQEHKAVHETINEQVRLVRQRFRTAEAGAAPLPATQTSAPSAAPAPATAAAGFDYPLFEKLFRGGEGDVRDRQQHYLPLFRERAPVLDVACGRGEFLALLREQGIAARGVDADPDMVERCREQQLDVTRDDAFAYLERQEDGSLGGIFSAQFIEHLATPQYVRLIEIAFRKLRTGGVLLLETQNPECLAIYSQSFYVDPTHVRPVPAAQLRFWMEETGFARINTHYVSPVQPSLPALPLLEVDPDARIASPLKVLEWNREAARFNEAYFGYQDYAVSGIKP